MIPAYLRQMWADVEVRSRFNRLSLEEEEMSEIWVWSSRRGTQVMIDEALSAYIECAG